MSEHTSHTALASLDKCLSYIDCHLQSPSPKGRSGRKILPPPSVAISRQAGAGGTSIAALLVERLKARGPSGRCPWTVFDKNLVTKVLEEHNLPERLAQFMPEDKVSGIADAVEELLGLHPPSWEMVRRITQTILHLAELGNAVFVGRAANAILKNFPQVLHVRLVASLVTRVQRVKEHYRITEKAAKEFIQREDMGRRRYVRRYFKQDVDDPLLYHLIINTDRLDHQAAAELIAQTISLEFA